MAARRFEREQVAALTRAIQRHPTLLHVLVGARQTGKTTAAAQCAERWPGPVVQASADGSPPPGPDWIEVHWGRARRAVREHKGRSALLVLDEIQKVRGWSEVVKALHGQDRASRARVRAVLVGSSALLVQRGLTESLAGRFVIHRFPHWTLTECRTAFRWDLDRWLFFGGYPGAARFVRDEPAWRSYVADALVEPAIARDVLALENVGKPALLRNLFAMAAQRPAQILSFTKMLGTLQDAGNTVTLAHYLRLLQSAFLASGLERLTEGPRERGSSPKLILWNNALVTALTGMSYAEARADAGFWGRLVENAVGAHLLNHLMPPRFEVGYWRERSFEVDFVVARGRERIAIEVKSGRPERATGLDAFRRRFPGARALTLGGSGVPLGEAFELAPEQLLELAR